MTKHTVRKILQIVAAAISYIVFGIGALLVGLFFRLLSVVPLNAQVKQNWIRWCIHIGCLAFIKLMRLLGLLTYSFDAETMLKAKGGTIIMANHPSLLDAVFILAAKKDLSCIVKSALWNNFFTGAVVRLAGYIPNNSDDVIMMAANKLQSGESILIFPEGTRNEYDEQLDFKRGASNIAVVASAPILPVLVKCSPRALQKGEKWYRIPDGGAHFSIASRSVLTLEQCIDTTRPRTIQYRYLTSFLKNYYRQWFASERQVQRSVDCVVLPEKSA